MKKFYTLMAIGLSLTVSAVAAPIEKSTLVNQLKKSEVSFAKTQKLSVVKVNPTTVEQNITNIETLAGEYDWSFSDLITNGSLPLTVSIAVNDAATGACTITFENAQYSLVWPVSATADMTAKTLTIPNKQRVGEDSDGPLYFYLKSATSTGSIVSGAASDANVVGEISGNTITFPAMSIWAIGDYNNESLGYYSLTYQNTFENTEDDGSDPNEGWTSVGNAKLQDGWVMPCFGDQTQEANIYNVPLQRNNENKSLFRLVDPFKGNSPVASYNTSTKVGYIQFDITDPDHVLFEPVEAGFANSDLGISKLYCLNYLGFAVGYLEMSVEEILSNSEIVSEMLMTTYRNGVVELTSVERPDGKGFKNDACFGIQGQIYGGYGWTRNDQAVNMSAKITLPADVVGINDVIDENNNAPVEYYNLQGIRVANPEKGQLVIARQGNKAVKYIVK